MLIDTHSHLYWDDFKDDLDQVLQRALEAGITEIINVGVDVNLSLLACQLDHNQPKIYSSLAIHPEEAIKYLDNPALIDQDIQKLEEIYNKYPQKVVAIGECGLDYSYFKRQGYLPPTISIDQAKDLQRQLFQAQINLAKKLNLPLLIHCRDDRSDNPENTECWDEVIEMTKDHFGIYHCYNGLQTTTNKLQTINFLISFAGNLTYPKNDYLIEAVKSLPLEKICLETDCPFLAPQSIRGQRNEPASVLEIAKAIAQIKNMTVEQVGEQTTKNVQRLFNI